MRVIHCLQLLQPSPVWGWKACFTRVCTVESVVVDVVGLAVLVQNVSTLVCPLYMLDVTCNVYRAVLVQNNIVDINTDIK